jgi:hypothetical protein
MSLPPTTLFAVMISLTLSSGNPSLKTPSGSDYFQLIDLTN